MARPISVWGNVESFRGGESTQWAQLKRQIEVARIANIDELVTYEFAQYWTEKKSTLLRDYEEAVNARL